MELVKTAKEALEKELQSVGTKIYQQAAAQQQSAQPNPNQGSDVPPTGGNDGNVYDADFKDVD